MVTALLLAGAAAAALCLGWSFHRNLPAPPIVELKGMDPAVRRAVEGARAAVLDRPGSASAWGKLGMVLQSHGLPVEAANACFAQAERLDPRDPRWPYLQGSSLVATDPQAALRKLRRAAEVCDCNPDAPRLLLGELLLDQGHLPEAAEQFRRVLQQHRDNARASLGLARVAEQRGELSEAITQLGRCVDDRRTRKAAHSLLARTYERLGNKEAARRELRQAQELPADAPWPDPFQTDILRLRVGKRVDLENADRLLHQNRFAEALPLLQRTLQNYPDEGWAWEMVGRACLGLKDLAGAERALRKATELRPDMPEAHFYLGVALILQKNLQAAASCFRMAAQLKPGYAEAHYNLGHSLKQQGDDAGAMAAFRTALSCKPDYSAAHYNLAVLLVKQGRKDEARIHLRHAVAFDPANHDARKLLEQLSR